MSEVNADLFLDDLKTELQVKTDTELAAQLGVVRGTVSSWRSRGTIPAHVLLKYHDAVENIVRSRTEQSQQWHPTEALVNGVFIYLRDRYRAKIQFDSYEDELLFWGKIEPLLKQAIREKTSHIDSEKDLLVALKETIRRVEHFGILSFGEIMRMSRQTG